MYRPQGALEFDLRGSAKGRGLGVAFVSAHRFAKRVRLTPLDSFVADGEDWQHVVIPVATMEVGLNEGN